MTIYPALLTHVPKARAPRRHFIFYRLFKALGKIGHNFPFAYLHLYFARGAFASYKAAEAKILLP